MAISIPLIRDLYRLSLSEGKGKRGKVSFWGGKSNMKIWSQVAIFVIFCWQGWHWSWKTQNLECRSQD